jgi:probable H4MPT-linked C1 transfer pathway protein
MNVLGLDVGGANLKAACGGRTARIQPFALWKKPEKLTDALLDLTNGWTWDHVAITMTGELCDCFETKRLGVQFILSAAREAFGDALVWRNDGRFVKVREAENDPLPCAAANWLALATFVGQYCPVGIAVLIDIGSTTTDIIPLKDGRPMPRGRTDTERLRTRELTYTGMRRTPICALLGSDGMSEFFATTQDVGLILGDIAEDANDCDTADQRPATRECALARLARMFGGDLESMSDTEIERSAKSVRQLQVNSITSALSHVLKHNREFAAILSGVGEAIGRQVCVRARRIVSLSDELGLEMSIAACANAVAQLAGAYFARGF